MLNLNTDRPGLAGTVNNSSDIPPKWQHRKAINSIESAQIKKIDSWLGHHKKQRSSALSLQVIDA